MKLWLLILLIPLNILFSLFCGSMDDKRIRTYIKSQDGEVISISRARFGKGWFGEHNNRIYKIDYKDCQTNIRNAFVKTSMFSGVYLSEDKITHLANTRSEANPALYANIGERTTSVELLIWENELMKQQIKKLKAES